jgi:hypothetical protein
LYSLDIISVTKQFFIIEYQLKNLIYIEKLKKLIEEGVSSNTNHNYKTNVKGKMTAWNFFNENKEFISYLDESFFFFKTFKYEINIKLSSSWGTILSNEEEVIEHDHRRSEISGILYLTDIGPGTFFPEFNKFVKEKIGKIVFFSSQLKHSVPKFKTDKKRYTIAFNFESHSF